MAADAATAFVVNPLFGYLSDRTPIRYGLRKPWIIGGMIAGALCLAGLGLSPNVLCLGIFWCLTQASYNAVFSSLFSLQSDKIPQNFRGKASALRGVGTYIGIAGGAYLVTLTKNILVMFIVPGIVGIIFVLWLFFNLTDHLTPESQARLNARRAATKGSPLKAIRIFFSPLAKMDFTFAWFTCFFMMAGQ